MSKILDKIARSYERGYYRASSGKFRGVTGESLEPQRVEFDKIEVVRGRYWTFADEAALMVPYIPLNPHVAFIPVEFNGIRTVMSLRHWRMWREISSRGMRWNTTLGEIAERTGLSRSVISRNLRSMEFRRWIDLATIRGPRGGVYIMPASEDNPAFSRIDDSVNRMKINAFHVREWIRKERQILRSNGYWQWIMKRRKKIDAALGIPEEGQLPLSMYGMEQVPVKCDATIVKSRGFRESP